MITNEGIIVRIILKEQPKSCNYRLSSCSFRIDDLDCRCNRFFHPYFTLVRIASALVFDDTLSGKLADGDPYRNPDQISVLELDARTFVSVVPDDLNTGLCQCIIDLLTDCVLCLVARLHLCNDDMLRRYRHRPDDAALVMVLRHVDDSLERTGNTNAVAAHPDQLILLILILVDRVHRR